ncbi:hypothetical protein HYU17_00180 [Candidatus Woesearchaeota archaeon]|nr:hypothetical protein [Candidatus Woesearchaeota archaeon]
MLSVKDKRTEDRAILDEQIVLGEISQAHALLQDIQNRKGSDLSAIRGAAGKLGQAIGLLRAAEGRAKDIEKCSLKIEKHLKNIRAVTSAEGGIISSTRDMVRYLKFTEARIEAAYTNSSSTNFFNSPLLFDTQFYSIVADAEKRLGLIMAMVPKLIALEKQVDQWLA